MIKDTNQALLDMLLGWARFIEGHTRGPSKDIYPESYHALAYELYKEANATLEKEGDATAFIRERLLPLFGGEAPPAVLYGWTEQDVLGRWQQLREWEEVVDEELPVEAALGILEKVLKGEKHYWEAGDEAIQEALERYIEANGLGKERV